MSSPPAAQLSEKTGNGPQRMRFSLQTLLGVMTLAAVLCAVLFSPTWHADERLLMSFWFAGLILGASSGRALGKPGIYSGALGAVLGTLLVCKYTSTARLGINASRDWDTSLFVPYLMFVIVGGWTVAVAVLTLYHLAVKGSLERWLKQPSWSRTAVPVLLIVGLTAYAIGQWRDETWRPVAELKSVELGDFETPHVDISARGDVIVAQRRERGGLIVGDPEISLIVFRNTNGRYEHSVIRPPAYQSGDAIHIHPEGHQVAISSYPDIHLFDMETQKTTGEIVLQEDRRVEYSQDGSQLLVTSFTPRIQRLRTFDVATLGESEAKLFPFLGILNVSPSGQLLARTIRAKQNSEAGIDLGGGDLEVFTLDGEVLGRIKDVSMLGFPVFSNDDQRVAMGNRIWNRANNRIDTMPGDVVGLIGSRQALVLRKELSPVWRDYLPAWLAEMPFLRHALSSRSQGELLLMDQIDGTVLTRTMRVADMMEAKVSRDGTTAVSSCGDGRIFVWQIPLAAQPLTPALSPEYRGEGGRTMQTSDTQARTPDSRPPTPDSRPPTPDLLTPDNDRLPSQQPF